MDRAGPFRVSLRVDVLPGREAEFTAAWVEGARLIAAEPANIGQWLAQGDEESGVFYITSDWTGREAFRKYEHSALHRAHRQAIGPYRKAGSMTTMQTIYYLIGAGGRT